MVQIPTCWWEVGGLCHQAGLASAQERGKIRPCLSSFIRWAALAITAPSLSLFPDL